MTAPGQEAVETPTGFGSGGSGLRPDPGPRVGSAVCFRNNTTVLICVHSRTTMPRGTPGTAMGEGTCKATWFTSDVILARDQAFTRHIIRTTSPEWRQSSRRTCGSCPKHLRSSRRVRTGGMCRSLFPHAPHKAQSTTTSTESGSFGPYLHGRNA
jgi:hypothetical protein